MTTNKTLIIDALNMYLRAYIVNPTLDDKGNPVGGVLGFLKSLQKMMREFSPDQCIIVWDGPGGSKRKRAMNANYKKGRKPVQLNRAYENLTDDQTIQNQVWQQVKLVGYLDELPIIQYMYDAIEADDIIGFLCKEEMLADNHKIIVSNDKDFLQLVSESITVYRPTEDKEYGPDDVLEAMHVPPVNLAVARAVEGDKSDNLEGVSRVGVRTLIKAVPELTERELTISEMYDILFAKEKLKKAEQNILNSRRLVEENYRLMQLYSPDISAGTAVKIREHYKSFNPTYNRTEFVKQAILDGFGSYSWNDLFIVCNRIVSREKKE